MGCAPPPVYVVVYASRATDRAPRTPVQDTNGQGDAKRMWRGLANGRAVLMSHLTRYMYP